MENGPMDDYNFTANEAASILGITGLELRNRLRAERPSGAIQIPAKRMAGGTWLVGI
jgi:hypothetical protein